MNLGISNKESYNNFLLEILTVGRHVSPPKMQPDYRPLLFIIFNGVAEDGLIFPKPDATIFRFLILILI